jgi:hypothetical protein
MGFLSEKMAGQFRGGRQSGRERPLGGRTDGLDGGFARQGTLDGPIENLAPLGR